MRRELLARRLAISGGMACGLWLSGCATVAPGAGTTTEQSAGYSGGRALQDFPRTAKVVSAAAAEALEDLKMTADQALARRHRLQD